MTFRFACDDCGAYGECELYRRRGRCGCGEFNGESQLWWLCESCGQGRTAADKDVEKRILQ